MNFSTSVSGEVCSIAEVRLILNGKSVGIAASEIIKKGMLINISSSAIINVCDCDNKAFLKLVNGSKLPLNYFLTRINIVKII
ncbi:hypothetical protein [Clostridium sp.]|uniref:hypothetical protein n=1 Tax=Clostridium sp. TaxID=1506 RepID=UPI0026DB777E|nr:hypothetical protein [Clostridium sp.]MDO5039176.1 hypothetical protein [Clostridium sp.]